MILRGLVAIVEGHGTPEERVIRAHGPGRFLGELGLLTGQVLAFTAVAVEAGEVLEVPVPALREVVTDDPMLGDLILRAYLTRRTLSIGIGAGFRIVGSRFSPDTRRLREFASRNRLLHRFTDVEDDAHAAQLLRRLGVRPDETPVVIWRDRILRNPSNAELVGLVGLRFVPDSGVGLWFALRVGLWVERWVQLRVRSPRPGAAASGNQHPRRVRRWRRPQRLDQAGRLRGRRGRHGRPAGTRAPRHRR